MYLKNILIVTSSVLALLIVGSCTGKMSEADAAPSCSEGIDTLIAALDGGAGEANDRTKAESELDEALEARDREQWGKCIDALEEAFEAIDMDEEADEMGEILEQIGGDHDDDD